MKSMPQLFMTFVFLITAACNGAKAVIYKVTTPFPAEEVASFIDSEMRKKGFRRYLMPYQAGRSFSWTTLNPTTGIWDKTDKVPARYLASWTNENRDEIAWIVIDYSPRAKIAKWEDTAQVSCQIAKLTAFNKDSEVVDKMMLNQKNAPDQKAFR